MDVRPMMVMRAMACMPRMAVKVRPRAPRAGGAPMLAVHVLVVVADGVTSERRGREEQSAVRSGKCLAWNGRIAEDGEVGVGILPDTRARLAARSRVAKEGRVRLKVPGDLARSLCVAKRRDGLTGAERSCRVVDERREREQRDGTLEKMEMTRPKAEPKSADTRKETKKEIGKEDASGSLAVAC